MTHIETGENFGSRVVVEGNITLGQFLKTEGIIESGGQAKWFLQDFEGFN